MLIASRNPWPHRLAVLTALATFPLIFMGGLVTSHAAGMSVPDWPNSYGYNMFLFPPRLWVGGILYEHVHRLMGSLVGFLSIGMTIVAWRLEPRRWARWLMTAVLGMVIVQGVLGGLRVVLVQLDLAIVHACVAQAFFCLATLAAVVTSQWWFAAPDLSGSAAGPAGRRVVVAAVVTAAIVYTQLIVAATMRHFGAGLAIPSLILPYGHVLPPTTAAQLLTDNHTRVVSLGLGRVSLGQIWLAYAHRVGAVVVSLAVAALVALIWTASRRLRGFAVTLVGLVLLQITLGLLTVYYRKPADVASLHVAVGALVLVTAFVIAVRAMRLYSFAFRRSPLPVEAIAVPSRALIIAS